MSVLLMSPGLILERRRFMVADVISRLPSVVRKLER